MGGQFSGLLIQTAVVYRRQSGLPGDVLRDRFGQPTRNEEEVARHPCRLKTPSGGQQMGERSIDVIVTNSTVYLERGADVREDDVITVLGDGGEEIISKADVTLVKRVYDGSQEHHREVLCLNTRQAA